MPVTKAVKMMRFTLCIMVEPDGKEFHAYCPALPGLHTSGDTPDEALSNARDAASAYIESLLKHGEPIPLGAPVACLDTSAHGEHVRPYIESLEVVAA
jgi:antitoxin HicB